VIAPLASSPSELEETLGNGWIDFCKKKMGQNATDEHRIVPFGSGENGHKRLAVSGMPAPRTYDLPDPSMGYFNVDPREKLGGDDSVEAEGGPKEEKEDVDHSDDVDVPAEEPAEEPAAEPPVGFSPPKARSPFLSPSLLFLFILFPSPPPHLHFSFPSFFMPFCVLNLDFSSSPLFQRPTRPLTLNPCAAARWMGGEDRRKRKEVLCRPQHAYDSLGSASSLGPLQNQNQNQFYFRVDIMSCQVKSSLL